MLKGGGEPAPVIEARMSEVCLMCASLTQN